MGPTAIEFDPFALFARKDKRGFIFRAFKLVVIFSTVGACIGFVMC